MIAIQLINKPIVAQKWIDLVTSESCGAIDIFIGTVRHQTQGRKVLKLDFEAYNPMVIKELEKIAVQVQSQWNVKKMAIIHRKGTLFPTEIAVLIAVSTPHRQASFEACQFVIDRLKESVPIWKKEFFEDGEIWVSAHP